MCRLIVLDIDDTLYLERDYVRSGFNAVDQYLNAEHGLDGFAKRAWELFLGGVRGNTFDKALGEDPSLRKLIPSLVEVYRSHRPRIQILPDAAAFITSRQDYARLAVVTDGPAVSQRAKIVALGIEEWAEEVVVTSEHGELWGKPSPRSFAHLQDRFGFEGSECVYFADNPAKDFLGPRELGWRTVRVRRPGSLHEHVSAPLAADSEVHTLPGRCREANAPTGLGRA